MRFETRYDRWLVVLLVLAVAEDNRFLTEVSKRCPQLERRNFGLGIPLTPPTII
jgi:hypothetical protein